MKNYFVSVKDDHYAVQVNSYHYVPAKTDGRPEDCYPEDSEIDWDLINEDGCVDTVAYNMLTEVRKNEIEEELWEQLEKEEYNEY